MYPIKLPDSLKTKLEEGGIEVNVKKNIQTDGGKRGGPITWYSSKVKIEENERYRELDYGLDGIAPVNFLLESDFEHFRFIEDYRGVWSKKMGILECEIYEIGGNRYYYDLINKFSQLIIGEKRKIDRDPLEPNNFDDEKIRFNIDEFKGVKLSIGKASKEFDILFYSFEVGIRPYTTTLKIENINIEDHNNAKSTLEEFANSLFFGFELNSGLALGLLKRSENNGIKSKSLRFSESSRKFPTLLYDKNAISLYWFGKATIEMPMIQFLSYYQIIEYFFPSFSYKDAQKNVKELLKDPRFDLNSNSDVIKLIDVIKINKSKRGFGSELAQLKIVLNEILQAEEFIELIRSNSKLLDYFSKKGKDSLSRKLSKKVFNLSSQNDQIINEYAARLYDIRCKIVHTKSSEDSNEGLFPYSPEVSILTNEILVLEEIVVQTLIYTGRTLDVNPKDRV